MRLIKWFIVVAIASAGGMIFGWAIGLMLAQISSDYVVIPSDYANLGLRAGCFAGTILAGCHVMTRKPRLGSNEILRSFIILGLVASGVVCMSIVVGLLLSLVQIAIPEDSNLAHPRRYVVFMAVNYSWAYAIVFGAITSSIFTWRRTRRTRRAQ